MESSEQRGVCVAFPKHNIVMQHLNAIYHHHYSVAAEIDELTRADIVIGFHTSSLTKIMFMPPNRRHIRNRSSSKQRTPPIRRVLVVQSILCVRFYASEGAVGNFYPVQSILCVRFYASEGDTDGDLRHFRRRSHRSPPTHRLQYAIPRSLVRLR